MIGSRKMSNCGHCKLLKNKDDVCNVCNGTHKIDEGRVYDVIFVMDGCGKELKAEKVELITEADQEVQESLNNLPNCILVFFYKVKMIFPNHLRIRVVIYQKLNPI